MIAVVFTPGPAWDPVRNLEDQDGLDGHIQLIRRNRAAGVVVEGAPFHDPSTQVVDPLIGLALLAMDSLEDAQQLIESDPVVQTGAFSYRLYPWWEATVARVGA